MVGENVNGDILLNPGSQRLPKPSNRKGIHIKYTYFGYIIAPDRDEAEAIFSAQHINKQHKQFKKSKVQQVADVGEIEKLHYDPLKVTSTVAINGYVDAASKGRTMKVSEYQDVAKNAIEVYNHNPPRQVQKADIEFKTL